MLKSHILHFEGEKLAVALHMINDVAGIHRMDVNLYDASLAETYDRLADAVEIGYQLVHIKGVEVELAALQPEQKLGAVAEFERAIFGEGVQIDAAGSSAGV